jgi:hypothetical protein
VEALKHDTNFRTTQDFERAEPDWRDFDIDPKTGRVTEVEKPKAARAQRPRKSQG